MDDVTDNNKMWANLLGKNLANLTNKKVEVINTGLPGLRAVHHYVLLKIIKTYNPDLVVFLVGINDWNNHIVNRGRNYLFPSYEIKYDFNDPI